MLLRLNEAGFTMKLVFRFEDELRANPHRVALSQALTLNASKPNVGLKGLHGLLGSPEWWESIQAGKMPLLFISGVVQRIYFSGQDEGGANNTLDLKLDDGSVRAVGIYVNNSENLKLFHIGCRVSIVYALDALKLQPAIDGGVNYSKIALEMAVSID
ncbi:hypothetical protein [Paraburkholderia caffeinilytica]|uniref:Uncharacterized protein n=1 Tax=Paraburkholderia caffeinilytica TaxID=1761016 RepID=A0ABQ1M122_9BURK|nr:hypothetical protein [Paraburkholderia caffeinilytica]GGC31936.1 hypothetical protein GCM10011400_18240 [Paraburkholderia caffeinilytica]CAB3796428.1 hypothetical protein LMG28690_04309 [Paraburkholderia caffeinilytica]